MPEANIVRYIDDILIYIPEDQNYELQNLLHLNRNVFLDSDYSIEANSEESELDVPELIPAPDRDTIDTEIEGLLSAGIIRPVRFRRWSRMRA